MADVRRIFVEKRAGFDIEARHMLADLKDTLGVAGLTGLRLFNRYDIEGLSEQDFERAAATILSDLGISIDAMRQAESHQVGGEETNQTDLVILTHECQEAGMNQALAAMQALRSVLQPIVRIRKEELN